MKTTKKALSVLLAVLLLAGCLSAAFNVSAATVTNVGVFGFSKPFVGDNVSVAIKDLRVSSGFTIFRKYVCEMNGAIIDEPYTYPNTTKRFQVRLYLKKVSGYDYADTITATVNGESANISWNSANESYLLRYTFQAAEAEVSDWVGSIRWNYNHATKTLTISGSGAMPDYEQSQAQPWRNVCHDDKCTTIVIENGVSAIGKNVFSFLGDVNSVTIPGTVKSIGESAFSACFSLENIEIPEGVESIGEKAFSASRLRTVAIPKTVETIDKFAFSECNYLKTVNYAGTRNGWNRIDIDADAFVYATEVDYKDIKFTVIYGECEVSLTASPAEGGTVTGSGTYSTTGTATVSATPNSGYHFVGWFIGSNMLNDNPSFGFTVTDDVTLTAKFEQGSAPDNPGQPDNPGGGNNQPTTQQQQSGGCKYCGGTHTGFPGVLIGFFHSILALFGLHK